MAVPGLNWVIQDLSLQRKDSLVLALGLSSCSTTCGILVPRPGIEPVSPAWQGGLLTPGPPEKPLYLLLYCLFVAGIWALEEQELHHCIHGAWTQWLESRKCSIKIHSPRAGWLGLMLCIWERRTWSRKHGENEVPGSSQEQSICWIDLWFVQSNRWDCVIVLGQKYTPKWHKMTNTK